MNTSNHFFLKNFQLPFQTGSLTGVFLATALEQIENSYTHSRWRINSPVK